MSGELIGVLAGMTVVGSLNIAILVFVLGIAKELGSLGARVEHLETGVTATLGARIDEFEEEIGKRVVGLEDSVEKRSDEIHALVEESRRLREWVAKAADLPPGFLENDV